MPIADHHADTWNATCFDLIMTSTGVNESDFVPVAGKKKPGAVTFGTAGVGTALHIAGLELENLTGIKMTAVHYRGLDCLPREARLPASSRKSTPTCKRSSGAAGTRAARRLCRISTQGVGQMGEVIKAANVKIE